MQDDNAKVKIWFKFLRYQTGAVTNLPPLQESRPEIPRVERERRET